LNLIRVMPAKGQDMQTSIFLAKLMGPFALAIGLAVLINRANFRALAAEFMGSAALMFLGGVVTLPAGLAVVLTHNVWTADWRVLITILGWLAFIGGVLRIIVPRQVADMGRRMTAHPQAAVIIAAIYIVVGAVLCFYGYRH
jgi:hypothetical protein